MGITRQALAFVLALLLANPVCCCTLGDLFASDGDRQAPAYSCCSKKQPASSEGQPATPDKVPSCPCAADDMALEKVQSPEIDRGEGQDFVIEVAAVTLASLTPTSAVLIGAAKLNLRPPGPSWRIFCCYLL